MATLQKIRNRGGVLIAVIIGLALGAFILGDMLSSGSKLMRPSQLKIAEIDGQSIEYPDFQKKVEELSEVYKMNSRQSQIDENTWEQIREQVWQGYLQENIIGKATDNLGISVTSEELFDLIQGKDPHPIIKQLFRNQKTGEVDKSAIIQFLKAMDSGATPEQKAYWLYIEKQIKQDRLNSKFSNLVAKGLYVTTDEAKKSLAAKNKSENIQYVMLAYSSIPDVNVSVSDDQLKAYYNTHKDEYKQEKSRTIEYITFDVVPSEGDKAATLKWINDAKAEFSSTADNQQYINANSDTRFDPSFSKSNELTPNLSLWAFSSKPGDFYGPYFENGEYKLAKIDQFKMLPDSVQASHILINPQTFGSVEKAKAVADSLKRKIELGENFAEIAMKYSEDTGSKLKGGDLGWFKRKQMVPEFEEAAFSGEINKLTIAATQYGFHIIKTTKKGKETSQVRLAVLTKKVEPSSATYQKTYTEASKFASENQTVDAFRKAVVAQKLNKKLATLAENERAVTGIESSRQLVRAAFTTEPNTICMNNEKSPIFEFGNKFVIAAVTGATEEGPSSFEEAKPRVELVVRKDKKGDMLAEKLKNASDLSSVASANSTTVKEASGINFTSYSIPNLGFEPAVIGAVCSLPEGKISAPIKGNNGVFVAKVTSVTTGTDNDLKGEKNRIAQSLGYRAGTQVFDALKKTTEIVDKRSKFY